MHQWCIQAVMFEHCTFILDNIYYTYRYNYNHNIFYTMVKQQLSFLSITICKYIHNNIRRYYIYHIILCSLISSTYINTYNSYKYVHRGCLIEDHHLIPRTYSCTLTWESTQSLHPLFIEHYTLFSTTYRRGFFKPRAISTTQTVRAIIIRYFVQISNLWAKNTG